MSGELNEKISSEENVFGSNEDKFLLINKTD